jgi:hypothetical protein
MNALLAFLLSVGVNLECFVLLLFRACKKMQLSKEADLESQSFWMLLP